MSKKQITLDCFARKPVKNQENYGNSAKNQNFPTPVSTNSSPYWQQKNNSYSISKPNFVLISRERFELTGCPKNLISTFQNLETAIFEPNRQNLNFHLRIYNLVVHKLRQLNVDFEALPNVVLNVFNSIICKGRLPKNEIFQHDLSTVDENLRKILFPYQLDAVNFVISKNGRALIADEMGVGKTLEALAAAAYYVQEWPLLIVSPANVRKTWDQAVKKFFSRDYLSPHNVFSPNNNREVRGCLNFPAKSRSVLVISYDLMKTNVEEILKKEFHVVIVDESHFIKNSKSDRCKATLKVLKQATRVILLSGTPALSRPVELYPQLQCINKQLFGNYREFVQRYCDAKQRPAYFGGGLDVTGASNLEELEILLKETVMIRRVKSDVMNQIKPKKRTIVVFKKFLLDTNDETLDIAKRNFFDESLKPREKKKVLMEYFNATSKAKTKCVVNHVLSLLRTSQRKMVVFAHHQTLMNDLEKFITDESYKIVRIDGATSSESRQRICDQFQKDDQIKLALLSITAANTGITLTAANLVVFGELYWNPGVLLQAEDRVHRKGQEADVDVQYLVAENTADDEMWKIIKAKMDVLGKGGLNEENFEDMSTLIVKKQENLIGTCRKKTLDDFWQDIPGDDIDDVEIIDDNVYTTGSGKKLNLLEIFPKISLENQNSIEMVDCYPNNSNNESLLSTLKIKDLKRSINQSDHKTMWDTTFVKDLDELFDYYPPSTSKTKPDKLFESILDSSIISQYSDDLFDCKATTSKSFQQKSIKSMEIVKKENKIDFTIDFSFNFDNDSDSESGINKEIIPSSPPYADRFSTSLPVQKSIADQNCSPIFKWRGISQSTAQKPLATVRPFKINNELVNQEEEPIASTSRRNQSTKSPPSKKAKKMIRNVKSRYGNQFVDAEAVDDEKSLNNRLSDEEINTDDDDRFSENDSFIDFATQPEFLNTQSKIDSPEMRAIYMKSVQSPMVGRRNKFRLAYNLLVPRDSPGGAANADVDDDEESFCYDSFVVPNDFVEYAKRRKPTKKCKRRRRLLTQISSDSDED